MNPDHKKFPCVDVDTIVHTQSLSEIEDQIKYCQTMVKICDETGDKTTFRSFYIELREIYKCALNVAEWYDEPLYSYPYTFSQLLRLYNKTLKAMDFDIGSTHKLGIRLLKRVENLETQMVTLKKLLNIKADASKRKYKKYIS